MLSVKSWLETTKWGQIETCVKQISKPGQPVSLSKPQYTAWPSVIQKCWHAFETRSGAKSAQNHTIIK